MSNNIKIICCDSTDKYKNEYKKYFNNYDILDLKYSDLLKNNDNQIFRRK